MLTISSGILTSPSPLRKNRPRLTRHLVLAIATLTILAGCSSNGAGPRAASDPAVSHAAGGRPARDPLPGMPPVLDPDDIYSADRPNALSDVVKDFPQRVYVPNTISNTVTVIDPATYKVIDTFKVGRLPQHVTPSYDLKTLWVLNDKSNSLTEINPATGKKGRTIRVDDPYNMYYTPDGRYAIVV